MSAKTRRRCYECGEGTIRPVAKAGRTDRYKTMTLEIPASLKIPTCTACGAEWMDKSIATKITQALEEQYNERIHALAAGAIAVIVKETTQRHLEELLGLSQGYVSKLRSGKEIASPTLAAQLVMIAKDPAGRLQEIADLWKKQPRTAN
jgi:hypothetical protein